jgi:hypothetical protein
LILSFSQGLYDFIVQNGLWVALRRETWTRSRPTISSSTPPEKAPHPSGRMRANCDRRSAATSPFYLQLLQGVLERFPGDVLKPALSANPPATDACYYET